MSNFFLEEIDSEFIAYSFTDPADFGMRDYMNFRLVYAGDLLKAAGHGVGKSRVWEKHQIRRYLHHQLKNLWETHPVLGFYAASDHMEFHGKHGVMVSHKLTIPESIGKGYEGFVPVVNGNFGMYCDLDILFLRAEPVGTVMKRDSGGGDLDNRIKTLFDALCIPQGGQVKLNPEDEPDPNPMFVLLSDDSLVTSFKVTADRLLTTATDDPAEACVVITR